MNHAMIAVHSILRIIRVRISLFRIWLLLELLVDKLHVLVGVQELQLPLHLFGDVDQVAEG